MADQMEPFDAFRARAETWLAANMPRVGEVTTPDDDDDGLAPWLRARELQRILYDGGFAGIAFPAEYGGLGLTREHQLAFNEASRGYEMPILLNVPTFTILAATLIDHGTEEQKRRHIPAILRGDEVWVQFLSEPSGGSDLASARTRATRDGDVFVINGSKIWSSGAFAADYAMILARTNWDVPKHAGLTMFIVEIHQPAITLNRIKQVNGSREFCEEFFDDVEVPASAIVGREEDGWAVATTLLGHEKNAVGGGSPYSSGATALVERTSPLNDLLEMARASGTLDDGHTQELLGEAIALQTLRPHVIASVSRRIKGGELPTPATAILKLFDATSQVRATDIAVEIAGQSAASASAGRAGEMFISRQARCLAGGSNEIQRNIISERVLGMPREPAADRGVAFKDVSVGRS
jgi:alkylation response protein AidB-like acyl-CoA dehydrogenase